MPITQGSGLYSPPPAASSVLLAGMGLVSAPTPIGRTLARFSVLIRSDPRNRLSYYGFKVAVVQFT